jgi:hypothetical protein
VPDRLAEVERRQHAARATAPVAAGGSPPGRAPAAVCVVRPGRRGTRGLWRGVAGRASLEAITSSPSGRPRMRPSSQRHGDARQVVPSGSCDEWTT